MTPISEEMQTDKHSTDEPLSEPVSSLSVELRRISAEILSINSNFQDQLEHALRDTHQVIENHYKQEFENALARIRDEVRSQLEAELRKEFEAELDRRVSHAGRLRNEVANVQAQLDAVMIEIKSLLEDPNAELSRVMRKRAEQVELQSYLHGLRYALGDE